MSILISVGSHILSFRLRSYHQLRTCVHQLMASTSIFRGFSFTVFTFASGSYIHFLFVTFLTILTISHLIRSRFTMGLIGNCPNETCQFPRNCRDGFSTLFPTPHQTEILFMQTILSLPGNV